MMASNPMQNDMAYHLPAPEIVHASGWRAAANTPWTERMRPHFSDHLHFEAARYTRRRWQAVSRVTSISLS
jgi:hypothetical protein